MTTFINESALIDCQARRAELMRRMGAEGIAIVPASHEVTRSRDTHFRFRQDSDFHYLTNFPEPEAIAVLLPHRAEGEYVLFVRERNREREIWDGRRAGPEGAVAHYGADQAFTLAEFDSKISELLQGRERLHYTLGEYPELDARLCQSLRLIREKSRRGGGAPAIIEALETSLHEMRLIKSNKEIEQMRVAGKISALAHVEAMKATKVGKNEWEIVSVIHTVFEQHNMQPGYGTICGGGDNACILHYTENNQPLRDGDLLLIDAGGEFEGYTGDITRTFPINGRFTDAQRDIYEVVLAAQWAAIQELKAGNSAGKPHEVSTRVLTEGMVRLGLLALSEAFPTVEALIKADKQKQFFMHGTGHWLGLDVHDVGKYKIGNDYRPFQAGMVMTVEPGIYVHPADGVPEKYWNIGIRIEDDVLVTDGEPEILTSDVPKTVVEIEALMAV
jgi:Xaa-Pro aminopeptidase